jgi:hypothetical protein
MTQIDPTSDIEKSDPLVRSLIVVAVFVIVGPPVGGAIAWLGMGAAALQSPLLFIQCSYGEGLLLAAMAGFYLSASWCLFWRTSFVAPIVGAVLANLVFHGATMGAVPDAESLSRLAYVFLPDSIVAAVVCWLLARRFVR